MAAQRLQAIRESVAEEPRDFSVVPGGPTFQLYRKFRLSGDELELLRRRMIVITLVAWLPLLLLAAYRTVNGAHDLRSFLRDIEVQVRFLVGLPALLFAEVIVHQRIRPLVRAFVERHLVEPDDLPRYYRAVKSAIRLRNSKLAELVLLVVVYSIGPALTLRRVTLAAPNWEALAGGHLTPAGFWYVFVSVVIVQFLLVRWYFRLFIWYRFLGQVSKLDLHLIPTHPDRAGGLGFLSRIAYAFAPLLFAQGALLTGLLANEILYQGKSLISFKWQIGSVVGFFVLVVMGPLVMFTPMMARAKRQGLVKYGLLAQRYVEGFEQKWVSPVPATSGDLLGTSDIQSLADLANSYAVVREMGLVPFGLKEITRLAAATAAPLLPLLLTVFSAEELLRRLVKILF
jgi:hypothetical protein